MNNRQKLNEAFSEIDDSLIISAKDAPKRRRRAWVKWAVIALAAAIASVSIIGAFMIAGNRDNKDDVVGKWVVIHSDDSSVTKQKTGLNGLQYALCVNYSAYTGALSVKPEKDECAEMLGQWLLSLGTLDYSQHFPLFAEEILSCTVYKDFEDIGITPEDANKKIAQVVKDTVGFTDCRIEYYVLDIKNSEEELQRFKRLYENIFAEAGLDVNKVEQVCEYVLDGATVCWNNTFSVNMDFDEYILYKYDGRWYVSPEMLENDLSIDFVQAKPGDNSYYREHHFEGVVDRIENGYLVIDDTYYFLLGENGQNIAVGDYVEIIYYSVGAEGKRLSDGVICNLGVLASASKTEAPPTDEK